MMMILYLYLIILTAVVKARAAGSNKGPLRVIKIMSFNWKDTIVLITGAANGIGASVVRLSLNEGVKNVTILDVDEENGVLLQNELNEQYGANKVKFIKCDITKEEQLRASFEAVLHDKSQVYVVINNAGILNDSLSTYRKEIEVNVTALVTGSLIALNRMRLDQGGAGGTIINISSGAALCPMPLVPIYNATKSAVLVFSTGIGGDAYYQRTNVRVLTMCFGLTSTNLVSLDNLGAFDIEMQKKLHEPLETFQAQSPESAAQAVIDMYKTGASASVWLSKEGKPVEEITDVVKKAFDIMSEPIYK